MSAAAQAQAAALHQLEITLPGLDATKYLSAAGFVILLYDHMLLFSDEIRLIWQARLSWPKILFLTAFLTTVSLGIATVFVVQRVYALWGRSKQILAILIPAFATVYILAFFFAGLSTIRLIPHISYNPFVKTCIADERPTLLIAGFAAPVAFDIFLFVLTWLNALSRPRHMHTALVSQLHVDGAVFFVSLLTLRLFNIIVVAVAPVNKILISSSCRSF
ncbi:hypothetical protein JB92DRAFT_1785700 [Gautieria morchelliformis]|nr:hypothetical protein JB92DRAFT_1785700 [Gautieria morchelliformis]